MFDKINEIVVSEANLAIIEAAKKCNFLVIDDHKRGMERNTMQLRGVAVYTNDDQQVVVAMLGGWTPYYSMNRMYIDREGKVHVSTDARNVMSKSDDDLEVAVQGWYDSFDRETVAKYPCLHPGYLTHVTQAA